MGDNYINREKKDTLYFVISHSDLSEPCFFQSRLSSYFTSFYTATPAEQIKQVIWGSCGADVNPEDAWTVTRGRPEIVDGMENLCGRVENV